MSKHKQSARKVRLALIVGAIGVLTVIGVTIAYNGNFSVFNNIFGVSTGRTVATEEFVAPDNWQPCQTSSKTITVKNDGTMPTVARIKYEEYWKYKNSSDTSHTTELPLDYNNNTVAITTVASADGWVDGGDGYYYFNEILAPGASTNQFLISVQMNCGFNYATGFTRTDGVGTTTYESTESDYSKANYHVYVTIETDDQTDIWCGDGQQGIPCPVEHRETLYDFIAKQTNGLDNDIRFSFYADSFSSALPGYTNGEGVNTVASHANDDYPVYYYRGRKSKVNNVVMFHGYCWRIIRTAERGAVKLLYSGQYTGSCPDPYNSSTSAYTINNGSYTYYYDGYDYRYHDFDSRWYNSPIGLVGYMNAYGIMDNYTDYGFYSQTASPINGMIAESVTWDGEYYHLVNPVSTSSISGPPYYHYFCQKQSYGYKQEGYSYWSTHNPSQDPATQDTCKDVNYWVPGINGSTSYGSIRFANGKTVEDWNNDLHTNKYSSKLKQTIDTWFSQNISPSYASKLADVGYCNDRTATYSPLSSPNNHYGNNYIFDTYVRVTGLDNNDDAHPSIDCADERDNFTVSPLYGNGALTYPVATITADELSMSGMPFRGSYRDMDSGYYSWNNRTGLSDNYSSSEVLLYGSYLTMSPLQFYYSSMYMLYASGSNINGTYSSYVRPVLALKYNTYIQSGDGTLASPYILTF